MLFPPIVLVKKARVNRNGRFLLCLPIKNVFLLRQLIDLPTFRLPRAPGF